MNKRLIACAVLLQVSAILLALQLSLFSSHQAHAFSRTFQCSNFNPDSADLSQQCTIILAEFADFWHAVREGRGSLDGRLYGQAPAPPFPRQDLAVVLTGHSFDERDGNNLAFLRAARVAHEMVRLGVPADFIEISGFDRRPFPLEPGNPGSGANRRVDILYR